MSGKSRKSAVRAAESPQPAIDAFRSQHLALAQREIATELGHARVTVDDGESPLVGSRAGEAATAAP